jgi:DNA-binding transcriptional ArsR family regulator
MAAPLYQTGGQFFGNSMAKTLREHLQATAIHRTFTIIMPSTSFTHTQQQLAQVAKALGHPARIAILEVLRRRETCYCGDIVEELPLAQATVSQHLKVLKEAGLIQGTIDPRRSCYCIDAKGWTQARALLDAFLDDAPPPQAINCCE